MKGAFLCAAAATVCSSSNASTSFTVNNTTADSFLATGSASNPAGSDLTSLNFGGAGTLAVAGTATTKGEFDSVLMFNTAAATSQFDSTYGAGNWHITGATLSFTSNFGTQGAQPNNNIFNSINTGSFSVDWLANDSWVEGSGGGTGSPGYPGTTAVSYNSISTLYSGGSSTLGTFTYTPPGNNVYSDYNLSLASQFTSDTSAGGNVSLYLYAADTQVSFLINSRSFASGHPELTLTAEAIPEPSVYALMGLAVGGFTVFRLRKRNA
jgi:hypothetical protein